MSPKILFAFLDTVLVCDLEFNLNYIGMIRSHPSLKNAVCYFNDVDICTLLKCITNYSEVRKN